MPDGTLPVPGGWNRIELVVDNLSSEVTKLKAKGLHFRNDIVTGPGGSQILLVDPSGNLIEIANTSSEPIDLSVFRDDADIVEPRRGIYRMDPGASIGRHETS